jgi:hypothetical protein
VLAVLFAQSPHCSSRISGLQTKLHPPCNADSHSVCGMYAASVISILWKLLNAVKRERFKHLAKEGEINSRTACMCVRYNALRLLLNIVHIFCLLTCIWFVLMLCAMVALLVLLIVGRQSALKALEFVQTAEKVHYLSPAQVSRAVCSPFPASSADLDDYKDSCT